MRKSPCTLPGFTTLVLILWLAVRFAHHALAFFRRRQIVSVVAVNEFVADFVELLVPITEIDSAAQFACAEVARLFFSSSGDAAFASIAGTGASSHLFSVATSGRAGGEAAPVTPTWEKFDNFVLP